MTICEGMQSKSGYGHAIAADPKHPKRCTSFCGENWCIGVFWDDIFWDLKNQLTRQSTQPTHHIYPVPGVSPRCSHGTRAAGPTAMR